MRIARRAGLSIAWRTRGRGPRPALFIHCTLASSRSLVPLMEDLGGEMTSDAFDLPGHGASADWTGPGDYLARSKDVARSFIETPIDIVGHSFGAVAALSLMVRHPELIRRAVLIEPVLFAAARGSGPHDRHVAAHRNVLAALAAGDREAAAARFTAMWGTGPAWPEMSAGHREAMASRIHLLQDAGPGLGEDSTGILLPGRLERVGAPVLLVRGTETHPVIPAILDALSARLPDAEQAIVPSAGHMAPITHVAAVSNLVRGHAGARPRTET